MWLRGIGETLITLGLVMLLFVAYELWVTDLFNHRTQSVLHDNLHKQWELAAPATPSGPVIDNVEIGEGLAVLRIPRLGAHYDPVVVEGVGTAALEKGPGHYPPSALPGEVGNFVVSGHRTTFGKPFSDLDKLVAGDPIVVETREHWFTYTVTTTEIVPPTDVSVILPVPHQPRVQPTEKLLTFTTCNPRFSASTRLIVFAKLTASQLKSKGLPKALEGATS